MEFLIEVGRNCDRSYHKRSDTVFVRFRGDNKCSEVVTEFSVPLKKKCRQIGMLPLMEHAYLTAENIIDVDVKHVRMKKSSKHIGRRKYYHKRRKTAKEKGREA